MKSAVFNIAAISAIFIIVAFIVPVHAVVNPPYCGASQMNYPGECGVDNRLFVGDSVTWTSASADFGYTSGPIVWYYRDASNNFKYQETDSTTPYPYTTTHGAVKIWIYPNGIANPWVGGYWIYSTARPATPVSFTGTPTVGNAPLSVDFTLSGDTNITSNYWDFGDGNVTSVPNSTYTISHTYSTAGTFSPTFLYTNISGAQNYTRYNYITVHETGVNTYFQAVNGQNGGAVHGANLYLKDATNNSWSNSTADADGTHFINSASDHLLDGYATATGFISTSRTGLDAIGEEYIYELIMWPDGYVCSTPGLCGGSGDPGLGNVNLIVEINNKETSAPISGASITTVTSTGSQQTQTSGDAGSAVFIVPNKSVITISAAKSGYGSVSKSTTTTAFGPDTVRIELSQLTVTTAPTLAPGVTATTTVLPGCEDPTSGACFQSQDQEMARQVREWMNLLIPLCGLAIIMFLFSGLGRR